MELIKRKILLENYTDRRDNSPTYGQITASTFYINIMLTQDFDDMGMFTDIIYIPSDAGFSAPVDYSILTKKLAASGFTFPFMSGIVPTNTLTGLSYTARVVGLKDSDYYNYLGLSVIASTESRLEDVRAYDNNNKYLLNFNTETETYINYTGGTVNGVNRVSSFGNPLVYVFDADKNDPNIGTFNQKDGLMFQKYTGYTNYNTIISYIAQGFNQTNMSLSALTKEEYLFGIISKPEVQSDVFIDRGIVEVYERHLKLSEITNLGELARYGKGYYNLTTY
jgi:hypothetical protein